MIDTIPVTRQEMTIGIENVVNRIQRRCRIINVRAKVKPPSDFYNEFNRMAAAAGQRAARAISLAVSSQNDA